MKIFVVATRNEDRPAEDFAPLMDPEADYALKLYKEEFVREIYSRTDGKGALVVVEAINEEKALEILSNLPLAKAGLLSFEVYGTTAYRGIIRGI
jgi:hypothetical protein|tara:strand:+ start:205 stop:489 length:285 start_codon:yes stop_codon:yes gene_type:complete